MTLKCLKPKESDFEPKTVGEHLRKKRLELGLSQHQAADRLSVNAWTVLNWEKNHTRPPIESMPGILQFLGYDPFPEPQSIPEQLLAKRRQMGWSVREAARLLGVDPGTWGDWERGKVILFRKHRGLVAKLLGRSLDELDREMTSRRNQFFTAN